MAAVHTETRDITLLKDERGGLLAEVGIATITFYKGDFKAAAAALRAQLSKVVAANPWLAGRLVKSKGTVCLRHPASPTEDDLGHLFAATAAGDDAKFKPGPNSPYVDTCTAMYASGTVIVGTGYATTDKPDKPLSLLTLAESAPGDFALVYSMSHVIGDGRTYYEILKMLQPGAAVSAMKTDRVMEFSEKMRDNCDRHALTWADSTAATLMYTLSPAMMGCGKPVKCFAFEVDPDRLAAAKQAGAKDGGVPYVTTNDILTSAFFNLCKSRIGMMGMDCRAKVGGLTQDLAGNYVTALVVDPGHFGTPAALRTMQSSMPYSTTSKPLPTWCGGKDAWPHLKKSSFAMATNWASFAGDLISLEGSEMVVHLPVHNPAYTCYDMIVPFSSAPGKVSCVCWTISSDEEGLRKALPVGKTVSEALFPC